jgi:starch phosphorylase
LDALGITPLVCHINEGHAAFSGLERIRLAMRQHELPYREARVAAGGGNVFTTHTPVPAGFDLFPAELIREFFSDYVQQLGISVDDLLETGRANPEDREEPLNMAIMAMRNSTFSNGVSRLHGKVTRQMVAEKLKDFPLDEIPVDHVTNGTHLRSWMSQEMGELLDRYLGRSWPEATTDGEVWKNIDRIPNTELWRTHERRRERLIAFSRRQLREQLIARGSTRQEIGRADEVLDPEALTIGFARRFATYKRATLLFRDRERLVRLLTDPERPVQLIFAGKAHPHDDNGKALIKDIIHFARDQRVRDRIVFLEGYNIHIARYLVQGVDVWLNTPRRPLEASGTSGMKVVANGGLNLSILDGWWDEGYSQDVGWAIGHGEEYKDTEYQDEVEASALYDLLEKSVIPIFYQRGRDQLPREWIGMMKASLSQLAPVFNTDRMVREYCERFYMPAKEHYELLSADDFAPARKLAAWKVKILKRWSEVAIEETEMEASAAEGFRIGAGVPVNATVRLGSLEPADVAVEMYVGRLDEYRRIRDGEALAMAVEKDLGEGRYLYRGLYTCDTVGRRGVGVRVLPSHPHFATKHEMGMMVWA